MCKERISCMLNQAETGRSNCIVKDRCKQPWRLEVGDHRNV